MVTLFSILCLIFDTPLALAFFEGLKNNNCSLS